MKPLTPKEKELSSIINNGLTIERIDSIMPRAGICNKCIQSLAGMEHCRGKEMGCICECKNK